MNQQSVDAFVLTNKNYFRDYQWSTLRNILLSADESKWVIVQSLQFKDPVLSLFLSILVGSLGVDCFYVGDIGLGILKLLTCGGAGIWTIVDWFLIMGVTRDKNQQKLLTFV